MLSLSQIKKLSKGYTALQFMKNAITVKIENPLSEDGQTTMPVVDGFLEGPDFWTNGCFVYFETPDKRYRDRFNWAPMTSPERVAEIAKSANVPAFLVLVGTTAKWSGKASVNHLIKVVSETGQVGWYNATLVRTFLSKVKATKAHPARFTMTEEGAPTLFIRNGRNVALLKCLVAPTAIEWSFKLENLEGTPLDIATEETEPEEVPEPETAEEPIAEETAIATVEPEPEPEPETEETEEAPEIKYTSWRNRKGEPYEIDDEGLFYINWAAFNRPFAQAEISKEGAGSMWPDGLLAPENTLVGRLEIPYLGEWYHKDEEIDNTDFNRATGVASDGGFGVMVITPKKIYLIPGNDPDNVTQIVYYSKR